MRSKAAQYSYNIFKIWMILSLNMLIKDSYKKCNCNTLCQSRVMKNYYSHVPSTIQFIKE